MTNLPVSQQVAAKELMSRRLARKSLLHFTLRTFPKYRPEPVHVLLCEWLDKVVNREINRLIIIAPPQHGKSQLVSVQLPPFWLGRHPNHPVILTSYAANLAANMSKKARAVVESAEYMRLFPDARIDPSSRAVEDWSLATPNIGSMLSAGLGGAITGRGAGLGIIDDPVENWEQAQSQTYRDRAWEWWKTTFRTRIWEDGAIIVIMTRWHEDDLVGRLLLHQNDDPLAGRWTIVRLPAVAETQAERDDSNKRLGQPEGELDPLGRAAGDPLSPGRYSKEALASLKRDVGNAAWYSEYQGTPRPMEGNRFKREWFTIVDIVPRAALRCRYWDKAASITDEACFTAGVLLACTPDGMEYIEDVVRGKWTTHQREEVIKQTAQMDSLRYYNAVQVRVEQEPGSGGLDSARDSIQNLAAYPVSADKVTGSKDVRLEPFARQAEAGNVRLLAGLCNGAYIDEMCSIPNGTFRDQADATAGAHNALKVSLGSATLQRY